MRSTSIRADYESPKTMRCSEQVDTDRILELTQAEALRMHSKYTPRTGPTPVRSGEVIYVRVRRQLFLDNAHLFEESRRSDFADSQLWFQFIRIDGLVAGSLHVEAAAYLLLFILDRANCLPDLQQFAVVYACFELRVLDRTGWDRGSLICDRTIRAIDRACGTCGSLVGKRTSWCILQVVYCLR